MASITIRNDAAPRDLAAAIGARFRPLGGLDLKLPAREPMRAPPAAGNAPVKAGRKVAPG